MLILHHVVKYGRYCTAERVLPVILNLRFNLQYHGAFRFLIAAHVQSVTLVMNSEQTGLLYCKIDSDGRLSSKEEDQAPINTGIRPCFDV